MYVGEIKGVGQILVRVCIKTDYFHTESLCHADDMRADMTGADNANGFAQEVKTAESIRREDALAHALISVNYSARQCKQ